MRKLLLLGLGILLITVSCSLSGEGDDTPESGSEVEIEEAFTAVLVAPLTDSTAPFLGTDGMYHVAYELELQNARSVVATIQRVDVVDASDQTQVILSLEGDDLLENLATTDTRPVDTNEIEPYGGRLLAINLAFASVDDVPVTLLHHLNALAANSPGSQEPVEVSYTVAPFSTDGEGPLVISPPLKGAGWISTNACCRVGFPHRFSVQTVNGFLINSQRFAIDFLLLNDEGMIFSGDPGDVNSYNNYGAEVYAVADGTIVQVINDLDDQVPGTLPDPTTITLQTVDGNGVVIDFGDGLYGFYAHMQKGSVQVEVGDEVKTGDLLGLLGNSGNTSAPHLHFHVMDGPSPIVANGVPFVFDEFDYDGEVDRDQYIASEDLADDFGAGRLTEPEPREDEYPMQLAIINFPD